MSPACDATRRKPKPAKKKKNDTCKKSMLSGAFKFLEGNVFLLRLHLHRRPLNRIRQAAAKKEKKLEY